MKLFSDLGHRPAPADCVEAQLQRGGELPTRQDNLPLNAQPARTMHTSQPHVSDPFVDSTLRDLGAHITLNEQQLLTNINFLLCKARHASAKPALWFIHAQPSDCSSDRNLIAVRISSLVPGHPPPCNPRWFRRLQEVVQRCPLCT
jgi:hypothetical protein